LVIGGVSPLWLRFSILNHKYLISAFLTGELTPSTVAVRAIYDYPLEALLHVTNVNDVVERELTSSLKALQSRRLLQGLTRWYMKFRRPVGG
jgi:hypothetical protein